MRSILFTAVALATLAGFAAEPQERESGDKLTREQFIRKPSGTSESAISTGRSR